MLDEDPARNRRHILAVVAMLWATLGLLRSAAAAPPSRLRTAAHVEQSSRTTPRASAPALFAGAERLARDLRRGVTPDRAALGDARPAALQSAPRRAGRSLSDWELARLYKAMYQRSRLRALVEAELRLSGAFSSERDFVNPAIRERPELGKPADWNDPQLAHTYLQFAAPLAVEVRAGQFMTPYGIINTNRQAAEYQTIVQPRALTAQLLPDRQLGLDLVRTWRVSPRRALQLHLTLSRAQGALGSARELQSNEGYGGRAEWQSRAFGALTLGASAYHDRKLRLAGVWPATRGARAAHVTLLAWAADARWTYKHVYLQSELVGHGALFGVPRAPTAGLHRAPPTRWTAYGLLGYRSEAHHLMPFLLLQAVHLSASGDQLRTRQSALFGVYLWPRHAVQLKVEYGCGLARSVDVALPGLDQRVDGELTLLF